MLRDLSLLEDRHPGLFVEFQQNRRFVGHKTKNPFSKLPIDQCNEQVIDWLKNELAVIGNLDNASTIRRDQVGRPELTRIVREFETSVDGSEPGDNKHHEQYPARQRKFKVHN